MRPVSAPWLAAVAAIFSRDVADTAQLDPVDMFGLPSRDVIINEMPLVDTLGRPLRNLRLSVTDRCNLRCQYCMPEMEYAWLPRTDVLRLEEINRLVGIFIEAGVDKVRLTGGEPLLRRDVPALVRMLSATGRLQDIALTTNGILLSQFARPLREAGLHRVTVSLDTLRPDRFLALSRVDSHAAVLEGIRSAREVFGHIKLDAVVLRGTNDDEIVPLMEYAKANDAEIRFIEYMDVGGATGWSFEQVVGRQEILEVLARAYGTIEDVHEDSSAPAQRFRLPDGTVFGIVASTTTPFCRTCDRSRLTADGLWYRCLYATGGLDLRGPLRAGHSDAHIRSLIDEAWRARDDRGAERRLEERDRSTFIPRDALRTDPHLEMHTRGG
jgi:cyclic pyranopterin phosphate synthase